MLRVRYAPEANLPHFHVPVARLVDMAFDPRHSTHVCPRHVRATVPQARGIRCVLKNEVESNSCTSLHPRLRHDL